MKFSNPLSKSLMVAIAFCTLNLTKIIAADHSSAPLAYQRKLGAILVSEETDPRLAAFKAHENHRDIAIQQGPDSTTLPTASDFSNEFPPVYDQKDIGSCTANAGCGALEYLLKKKLGDSLVPQSRQFLYHVERLISENIHDQNQTAQDCGAQMFEVPMALHRYGSCPESMWPYEPTSNYAQKPTDECFQTAKTMFAGQKVIHSFVPRDLIAMKTLLSQGIPIVFGISVYASFMDPVNGLILMPGDEEQKIGGHALIVTGYNDDTQRFTVRNSWGSDWGVNGHCYIPYDYIMNPELAQGRYAIQLEDITVADAADQRGFVTRMLAPVWGTVSATASAITHYIPFISRT